jgi:membrane carboxypeptidase/penicillin-binding protein
MPTVSQTVKFRNQKRLKNKRSPWAGIGLGLGIFICVFMALVVSLASWYYASLTRNLPSVEVLPSLLDPSNGTLLQPSQIYDRSGEHILLTLENPSAAGKHFLQVGRDNQTGEQYFSQYLIDATVAEFEPGFWTSPGISLAGMVEGEHPTLAQRLISDLVLDGEPASLQRNIRERLLAAQITSLYGRETVLEWYLNSAQYGEMIYGADAASRAYFGKSASDLNLAEAAMLTAICEIPMVSTESASQLLVEQQKKVINSMLTNEVVNPDEAQKALLKNLTFNVIDSAQSLAPAFTELVLMQLGSELPLERILRGGYDIVTSIDYDLQTQAVCATQAQVDQILGNAGQATALDDSTCEAAQLLPTLQSNGESQIQDVSVNLIIQDPSSGQILAMIGGESNGNIPSLPETHPSGTIISPFLYLTAFTRGMSPSTLLWDIPQNGDIEGLTAIEQDPSVGTSHAYHGPVRLRTAFINDYYSAASTVLQQVGLDNVLLTEKRFGINTLEPIEGLESTIGDLYAQSISLLDGVQAYAVLANQGTMAGQPLSASEPLSQPVGLHPNSILQVKGVDGKLWLDRTIPQYQSIIDPQLAYLTTNVLSDETGRWPSLGHPNSFEIGRPAAAKGGNTESGREAWAIGYVPQLVVGVWMGSGGDDNQYISSDMPAGLWHAVMQYATKNMPVQEFKMPEGINLVQVCDPSGLLVSDLCPSIVQEVFLIGTEPTQVDNLYQKFYINRDSGHLATIFTPLDMLAEEVYMVVPPHAQAWAEDAGMSIPPDNYDVIYAAHAPSSQFANITKPLMFDHVHGRINLNGTAAGPGFSFYRLQVGNGLNPQQWIQIGEDEEQPVNNGILGTWDTADLQGLYIVQLLVVYQDQRVERDLLQITIDNHAPDVKIITPTDGEEFVFIQGESIMLQAEAEDDLVVDHIEFYINGILESTLYQPPHIILWQSRLGHHTLTVKAYDLAGNSSEVEITFIVGK